MKHSVLIFLISFLTSNSFGQDMSDYNQWPYEVKIALKEKSQNVIDRIFPKIQSKESWAFDRYNSGSIDIANVRFISTTNGEMSFEIDGTWSFTRNAWLDSGQKSGTFTAKAQVTQSLTVYMKQVCWQAGFETGNCHTTTDWAYANMQD